MRVSFNWLKDYVDIRIPAEAVAEKLTMTGLEVTALTRIEQDVVLEIEVTPNRTDCLSVIGIAREVAAVTGKRLKLPKIPRRRALTKLSIPVQIQERELCRRYLGRVIRNVELRPSPEWLSQRLETLGVRSVNNIVDITNFCLLESGQPLHVFDLDKLEGLRIVVRRARPAEEIVTIDGVRRQLQPQMLVVADRVRPQALAGIMGAKTSEVSESTENIFLESASFAPLNIHHTSRKLGLATESSYRFERGIDLEQVYLAALRATELIYQLARPNRQRLKAGGRVAKKKVKLLIGKTIDKGTKAVPANKVRLRLRRVRANLGVEVAPQQIKDIFQRLGLAVVRRTKQAWVVKVPAARADVSREADLIEEVARLYGYDRIPLSLTKLTPNLSSTGNLQLESEVSYERIREILYSLGLSEIITYSLVSRQNLRKLEWPAENAISVKNPLSYEQEIMRPTLMVGMLNALLTNVNRKNTHLAFFELSRIYQRVNLQQIAELTNLCIAMAGKKADNWMQKSGQFTFFDLKGVLQTLSGKLGVSDLRFVQPERPEEFPAFTLGRLALLLRGADTVGLAGELSRKIRERFDLACAVYICELRLPKLLAGRRAQRQFVPLAKFPAIERDISLVLPQEIHSEEVIALIKKFGGELVTKVKLFDQYFGEQIPSGCRGLAYSIEYRSPERTLKTEEVDRLHARIRQALSQELKARLR